MTDAEKASIEARRVLEGNRLRGTSAWEGKRFDFVCPSPTHYPFQWLWDSAFHAIALLHVDPELAKQELRCLLQGQRADGFIPHMILWEKHAHQKALSEYLIRLAHPFHTATIQPPVLARALFRIHQATGDDAFLRETMPKVLSFFRWLDEMRDLDRDGLISIVQPDESGLDCSPKFDAAMGIPPEPRSGIAPALKTGMERLFSGEAVFECEDVMVNSIYADGLNCLAALCPAAAMPEDAARRLRARAAKTVSALETKCWDEEAGAYFDLSGPRKEKSRVLTFTSLFPLILPEIDPARTKRLIEHLLDPKEFWLEYPVPSVAATEPSYEPDYSSRAIWRGPTWVNANWYLFWGLRTHGRADAASELAARTIRMVAIGGMREFFDPRNAAGMGATDFGWSTLVLDVIAAGQELACAVESDLFESK
ncbi:MAG: hypothetical protein HY925_05675 [Elusimicrobia bacterium]|nr:hypothetical protein [Elusimicrobiota bacterium]